MDQVTNFFENIFSTSGFSPLWQCGYWTSFHGWLQIVARLLIVLTCFFIPVALIRYKALKKSPAAFNTAYSLAAAFCLLYGMSQLLEMFVFWVPVFRFNTLALLLSAIAGLFLVFYLFIQLPDIGAAAVSKDLENKLLRQALEKEEELRKKETVLRLQNEKLSEIAWIGSHRLRGPVASILGLSRLFNHENLADPDNAKIIEGIYAATKDMDSVVIELVEKASTKETIQR